MKKLLVYFTLLVCIMEVQGQASLDMVVLRNKQNRTIKSYFSGIPITFADKTGQVTSGTVKKVSRDSIYIQQFDIRRTATMWGTQVQDTVGAYLLKFHPNEIVWIKKNRSSIEPIRNGSVFMIGGLGYSALHSINAAYLGEPILWSNLAIAGGAVAAGYIMKKLRSNRYVIGKKYTLNYIDATPVKSANELQ
ncbi:MAG: hypothetical protein ACK4V4_07910 [Sphingobacteriales bacterium]|jgi:hypothetical protein